MHDSATRKKWVGKARSIIAGLTFVSLFLASTVMMVVASSPSVGGFIVPDFLRVALRALASFTGVSIAATFLYKVLFQPQDSRTRIAETKQAVQDLLDKHDAERTFGFVGFLQKMDYGQLFRDCNEGDQLWWHDTYCPSLVSWIDDLQDAIERGVVVRMLIQKPECENAKHRKLEIRGGYFADNYIDDLHQFRKTLVNRANELRSSHGRLEICEYDDLPSLPIYLVVRNGVCRHAYTSFFLGHATGVDFPHMHWVAGEKDMTVFFSEYLEKKWKRATPLVVSSSQRPSGLSGNNEAT